MSLRQQSRRFRSQRLSLPLFSPPLSNEDRRRANPERQQEDQQDTD